MSLSQVETSLDDAVAGSSAREGLVCKLGNEPPPAKILDERGRLRYVFAALGISGQIERIGIPTVGEALREAAAGVGAYCTL